MEKSRLGRYLGTLRPEKLLLVERALAAAVGQSQPTADEENETACENEE